MRKLDFSPLGHSFLPSEAAIVREATMLACKSCSAHQPCFLGEPEHLGPREPLGHTLGAHAVTPVKRVSWTEEQSFARGCKKELVGHWAEVVCVIGF